MLLSEYGHSLLHEKKKKKKKKQTPEQLAQSRKMQRENECGNNVWQEGIYSPLMSSPRNLEAGSPEKKII